MHPCFREYAFHRENWQRVLCTAVFNSRSRCVNLYYQRQRVGKLSINKFEPARDVVGENDTLTEALVEGKNDMPLTGVWANNCLLYLEMSSNLML